MNRGLALGLLVCVLIVAAAAVLIRAKGGALSPERGYQNPTASQGRRSAASTTADALALARRHSTASTASRPVTLDTTSASPVPARLARDEAKNLPANRLPLNAAAPVASPAAVARGITASASRSPGVANALQPGAASALPPGVPYASESDPIRIQSIQLSSDELHGGDIASAHVITTSNAAALTARIGTYQINVPRTAPGTFAISIKVPHLPVAAQTVNIVVDAIRSDGVRAQKIIPVKVSY